MSDLISRQSVLDEISKLRRNQQLRDDSHNADLVMHGLYLAEKVVENLPSAQPEVIRCKDCIHYTPLGIDGAWGRCHVHSSPTENQRMCQEVDYCSWAELRGDSHD